MSYLYTSVLYSDQWNNNLPPVQKSVCQFSFTPSTIISATATDELNKNKLRSTAQTCRGCCGCFWNEQRMNLSAEEQATTAFILWFHLFNLGMKCAIWPQDLSSRLLAPIRNSIFTRNSIYTLYSHGFSLLVFIQSWFPLHGKSQNYASIYLFQELHLWHHQHFQSVHDD